MPVLLSTSLVTRVTTCSKAGNNPAVTEVRQVRAVTAVRLTGAAVTEVNLLLFIPVLLPVSTLL